MAHLPFKVRQIVDPFLRWVGKNNFVSSGYTLEIFNVMEQKGLGDDLNVETLIDALTKYHWWFVSFGFFNTRLYECLEREIKIFNNSQNLCDLYLQAEQSTYDARLLHTDSEAVETFFFIISAGNKQDKLALQYTLPCSLQSSIDQGNEEHYIDNEIEWIDDSLYEKENTLFCKYVQNLYFIETRDLHKYACVRGTRINEYQDVPELSNAKKFMDQLSKDQIPDLVPYIKQEKCLEDYMIELLSMLPTDPNFSKIWNTVQLMSGKHNFVKDSNVLYDTGTSDKTQQDVIEQDVIEQDVIQEQSILDLRLR